MFFCPRAASLNRTCASSLSFPPLSLLLELPIPDPPAEEGSRHLSFSTAWPSLDPEGCLSSALAHLPISLNQANGSSPILSFASRLIFNGIFSVIPCESSRFCRMAS